MMALQFCLRTANTASELVTHQTRLFEILVIEQISMLILLTGNVRILHCLEIEIEIFQHNSGNGQWDLLDHPDNRIFFCLD